MDYGAIFVGRLANANAILVVNWTGTDRVPYTKYSIKETDFRVKTATFTSPYYMDLTTGAYAVLISSIYHENFAGRILDVEYDEDTGLYSYQCQDWSRTWISKFELIGNNLPVFRTLRWLITRGGLPLDRKANATELKKYKEVLSGLRPLMKYDQSLYSGNIYKGNPMEGKISFIARDKTFIETIRDIVYSRLGFFDVWFNDRGVIQIEPISKTDWENTGLMLADGEYYNRKFKFSTTNAITNVIVNGNDLTGGKVYFDTDLVKLDLSAFFGNYTSSISDPNANNNTSKAVTTTAKKTSTKKTTTTKTNKYGNPFNNKPKRVWINSDNGSNSMKNGLISALKKAGWSVHDGGTWSNAHIQDVFNVTSSYSVYITLYNGFCAGTMREAYSSYVQNPLRKKGVQLVPIWDSSDWTDPHGMKPYRYGDFSGYNASRAWDDNFSSGDPSIRSVGDWLKKNKATYCVSPTVSQIMQQFNKGGYFKYKGIKV